MIRRRFAGKADSEAPDGLGRMHLIGMPFSEDTFLKVATAFRVPQSIERVACRNTSGIFSLHTGRELSTRSPTIGK